MEITDLNVSFENKKIFSGFSAEFPDIGTITLMGNSGCGKTTLLRVIAGLEKRYSGKIIGTQNKKISFVFQEDRLLPWLSVEKNVSLVADTGFDVCGCLDQLGIGKEINSVPGLLSGGMKRRVEIARALAFCPDIILLDEPFNGLDQTAKQIAAETISEFCKQSLVLLVTHDRSEAELMKSDIFLLDGPPVSSLVKL